MKSNHAFSQSSEFSLEIFDRIPSDHIAYPIEDMSCEPLIRPGELAIVDLTELEPIDGAIYLMRSSRFPQLKVAQAFVMNLSPRPGRSERWAIGPYNRPANAAAHALETGYFPVVDGLLPIDYLRSRIVGRVVGVICASSAAGAPDASAALLPIVPGRRATNRSKALLSASYGHASDKPNACNGSAR